MALGKGKYDDALELACQAAMANTAVLIVLNGKDGPGMSCRATIRDLEALPSILRSVADQFEEDAETISDEPGSGGPPDTAPQSGPGRDPPRSG